MMRRYRMFQAPIMAFFSPTFYRDVGLHWKGTGFFYLLLLLAICWVPDSIRYHLLISRFIDNKAPAVVSQIPSIRISQGQASVNVAQPHQIIYPDTGAVLAVIDTTDNPVSLEGTHARVLLTKTKVMFKKNEFETRSFNFKNIEDFTLDQEKVSTWLRLFRDYSAIVFYSIVVIGSFAFRIVQVLLYAAIGLLFAKLYATNKSYQTLLRLSVMAITPVIIARTIFRIASFKIPLQGLLFFIVALVYLLCAVKAVSRSEDSNPTLNIDI